MDNVKISSILCDERFDNAVVRVNKHGFHPHVYYIQKGQSVLWTWKGEEEEEHNIIHVKSPDSDVSTAHWRIYFPIEIGEIKKFL
ncbi:hypothetical protein DPMN_118293 [Dreissena polymorpha]|uniref:Uncharacterized protein n=1 Tax=Dreissena polymorpha TaxID=45954 RepID=A0A9D4JLR9_DREPO|nr:hypothetical protein DPMN_118293 [Dreissena polymorpha]